MLDGDNPSSLNLEGHKSKAAEERTMEEDVQDHSLGRGCSRPALAASTVTEAWQQGYHTVT